MPTFTVSFLVGRFGSPTKIDYRKGTRILTSPPEDLVKLVTS